MSTLPPSVCVFCGARAGHDPAFTAQAQAMGRMLAARGWRLVYGAGDVGLMGAVAQAVHDAGGASFGVIPEHLLAVEAARPDLNQLVVTRTMHERKELMFANSHAVVVLPGGAGSLDEFFEVLTWRQLGLHARPILLLGAHDYWAPLLALIDHVIAHGFADAGLRDAVTPCADVAAAERALAARLDG